MENSPDHVAYGSATAAEFSEDTELPGILDAIAADVQRQASAARHAVMMLWTAPPPAHECHERWVL
jgi:hypothetical protein